jgi:hypothetical protein
MSAWAATNGGGCEVTFARLSRGICRLEAAGVEPGERPWGQTPKMGRLSDDSLQCSVAFEDFGPGRLAGNSTGNEALLTVIDRKAETQLVGRIPLLHQNKAGEDTLGHRGCTQY